MSAPECRVCAFTDIFPFVLFRSLARTLGGIHLVRVTLLVAELPQGGIDHSPAAFSLSSGTIGAALAGSLSGVRSIALSYGIMIKRTPTTFHDPTFKLRSQIINRLLNNWGRADLLYSINIPMIERLLHDDGLKIYWTSV